MTAVLYGIRNCDTVRRARQWLDRHGIEYRFHDFRSDGLEPELARQWLDELGLDAVVNRRGATWRQLDQATRDQLCADAAPALLAARPTLVRRPVLDIGHQRFIGFDAGTWQAIFKVHTL